MTNHNTSTHDPGTPHSGGAPTLHEIVGWFENEGLSLSAAFETTPNPACDRCVTPSIAA